MSSRSYSLFPRNPSLFSSLNVQKNMLQDWIRISQFKKAIKQSVKPGDIVIDLGTGTGIFAIWALEAGASHVFAIEESDVAEVASAVINNNGLGNKITVLRSNSKNVEFSELADVLIAEIIGHFFFEEGIVEAIADVRDRLLKPNARIIPNGGNIMIALAELDSSFSEVKFWEDWEGGMLEILTEWAANNAYVYLVNPNNLLSSSVEMFTLSSANWIVEKRSVTKEIEIKKHGEMNALVGWFDLQLIDGIELSTSPFKQKTHWEQCVFPFHKAMPVEKGDRVIIKLCIEPFGHGSKWFWEASINSRSKWFESHEFSITYGPGSRLIKERF